MRESDYRPNVPQGDYKVHYSYENKCISDGELQPRRQIFNNETPVNKNLTFQQSEYTSTFSLSMFLEHCAQSS